jgi:uncharacterized repeat protein (TIGR01451 family)
MKKWLNPPQAAFAALLLLSVVCAPNAFGVNGISSNALQQISALIAEKDTRSPAQLKMDSQLLYALKQSRGQPMAPGVPTLQFLPTAETNGPFNGLFKVDIDATVSSNLLAAITNSGGVIENSVSQFDAIRAGISLALAEQLAGRPDVRFVRVADKGYTHTGSVDSEGDVTQTADLARAAFGVDGGGVKVGVLSDSVDHLGQSQATGDLPPNVTVLPGQSGVPGTGEGTAMLEIVHDLAPGASLYFAAGLNGQANFAQNILNLRAAGCDIIVDDIGYFAEPPFQDGVIARAVNSVTADGALYFSSAGNDGNKTHGTSGTWEGDFLDGGAAGSPVNGRNGNLHDFGNATLFNTATGFGGGAFLFWADALNASTNDYDLFVLDSTGATVLAASTTVQNGSQSAIEGLIGNLSPGLRIVVVKVSGDVRFLHLDTLGGQLQVNTAGNGRGHNAATNAFSVAAVDIAHAFPRPFAGGGQDPVEDFSSDGPRRVFFQANGTAITPNNFTNTGGTVRQFPVIASSDGVSTSVPGFAPFFGTSAAAPHAASIAALLKSLNSSLNPTDVRNILTSTALDVEAFGVDNNSGYGLVMALAALRAAPPGANLIMVTNFLSGGNGNGIIDPNECNNLTLVLQNVGALGATNIVARLSSSTPGVIIAQRTSAYADLPQSAVGTNVVPFSISTSPSFVCGTPVNLSILVKCDQQTRTFNLTLLTGTGTGAPIRFDSTTPVLIPDADPAGASSLITVSNFAGGIKKVSVGVFINHPFDVDLLLTLIAPDGTTNVLSANETGNGSSLANFGIACAPDFNRTFFDDDAANPIGGGNPPFLGTFKPETPFVVYQGKIGTNVNGVWQLHAVDQIPFGIGTIQCWSLLLSPASCVDGGGQCPGVDLSIGMTPNPEPVFVGNNLVYTITVTNAGPDLAKNVVVSQSLPIGVVYVSGSASQGSVSQSGGVVTGNLGNMPAGSVATMFVTVIPTQVGLLSTTATVASQNNDFDLSNNSVTVLSHVNPPFADLAVGLLGAPNPTLVGQILTYTVSLTNRGPAEASFVTVTNVLPTTVSILNATPSQGFVTISDNVVVCNFGNVSDSGVVTANINVVPLLEGTIVATASASAAQIDPILANNTVSATTVVGPAADLAIGIADNPDPVIIRSNLTYVISVTNRGPSSATGVVINDTLPAGVSVVSTNSTQGTVAVSGSTVTAVLGNMTNGARATLTVVVTSTNSGTIFNTANVTGDQADPNSSNNSATASTVVAPPFVSFVPERAVLTFESLSPTNGTVEPGESVTVNLYLRNAGNVVNTNLFATLLALNGVTAPSGPQNYGILAPSASIARPFSFTASGAAGDSVIATLQLRDINIGQGITNNLGTVSFTFILPSTVTFANTNRIDIPTTLQDQQQPGPASPYPSPITVSGVTGLVGKVTVTLSNFSHTFPHDVNLLLVGPSGVKTLLMSHAADGPGPSGVDLTFDDSAPFALPASGGITSGAWKPSVYDPAPTFTNPAPAGPYNSVLSVFNGPIMNGDWLLYANDDSQGDFGNVAGGWSLSFTVLNPVNQIADLLAAASASPNPVLAGNNVTNVFSITNTGPNDASFVWVTNTLSPNEVLISADNTLHAAFTTNGNNLVCNIGGLAAGASARFTIIVSPTVPGQVTNGVSVIATSGEVDLNPVNNSAFAIVTAGLPQADLGVSVAVNPNPVTVGSNLTATVTVTNSGPNAALNVVVSNAVPAGVNYVSGSASQGTVSNLGGVVVANLGTLPSNGSASVNFSEQPFVAGSVTNTARVSSLAVDGNSANNSASAVSAVLNPVPRILVPAVTLTSESVSPPNGTLDTGETVTASFTFTNAGAADSVNLVATLLATNGVTAPSAPVNIGALVHGGAATARSFTFTAGAAPSGVITATFQLQDGANDLGLATFAFTLPTTASYANLTSIIIPDHGTASPYPSTIPVSGRTGVVGKVTVTLNGVTHGFPDDIDVILVSPSGQKVVLMSDTGGGRSITNVNLTFDDSALATLPDTDQILSGTYQPTDFEPGDNFPPPAPVGAVSTFLSAFNGSTPNGNWSLYVVDDSIGDSGLISSWSLSISTINPVTPAVNLVLGLADSPDPVFVGNALTYTLSLTNRGPATATGVYLTDILAPGVTLVSSNTTYGTFSLTPTFVTINVGTLTPGAGLVATLRVSPSLAGVIPNTATATNSPAQIDLDPTSNFASIETTVLSPTPAVLAIQAVAGQQLLITLTAAVGQTYTVQGSANFTSWSPVFTATIPSSGILKFTIPNSSSYRFFRAVRIP